MLRRIAAACAATLALSLAASPAHADWSFTKWGMSPEQVIKSAGPTARPATGDYGDRVMTFDRRAAAQVKYEGRSYTAEFYFDLDGGRGLRLVRLNLLDQTQCDALGAALEKRYGASSNQYHGEWRDPATGDTVFFSKSYKTGISLPCYLSYNRS